MKFADNDGISDEDRKIADDLFDKHEKETMELPAEDQKHVNYARTLISMAFATIPNRLIPFVWKQTKECIKAYNNLD